MAYDDLHSSKPYEKFRNTAPPTPKTFEVWVEAVPGSALQDQTIAATEVQFDFPAHIVFINGVDETFTALRACDVLSVTRLEDDQ